MEIQERKKLLQTERRVIHSFGFWLGIALGLVVLDQLAKHFVDKHDQPIFLNNNFAFGIPLPTVLMFIIYVVVLLAVLRIVFLQWRTLTSLAKFGWVLILAGGISNIVERAVLGHVRDFIFIAGGVFNAADFFIIAGLLIVLFTYHHKKTLS